MIRSRSWPDDPRVLTVLGVDPHALEAAPDGPSRHCGYQARIHPLSPGAPVLLGVWCAGRRDGSSDRYVGCGCQKASRLLLPRSMLSQEP